MGSLLNGLPLKTTNRLEVHQIEIIEEHKSEKIMHYNGFANDVYIDFISLRFMYIILTQNRSLEGI